MYIYSVYGLFLDPGLQEVMRPKNRLIREWVFKMD